MDSTTMLYYFLTLALCGLVHPAPSPIGLFSIVQFPNDACTSASSLTGTCLTSTECTSRSGAASGTCAAGFGVCCLVTSSTCSTTISQNNTYIQNPSYPSTYPTPSSATMCSYTVNKVNDNICQLRLDFQTQELGITATTGACTDTFQATLSVESSSTTANPSICGTNTGQHMYLHLGRTSTSTATLKYSLASGTTGAKWNVLVQQIECDATYAAPDACTQYLTGVANSWMTYGYDDAGTTEHLQGQSYRVCMRKEAGYCTITHSSASATSFAFAKDANAAATTGERGGTNCYLDFLGIPGGYTDGSGTVSFDRFCGVFTSTIAAATASTPISSNRLPFEVQVETDTTEEGAGTPRGASMKYMQSPC